VPFSCFPSLFRRFFRGIFRRIFRCFVAVLPARQQRFGSALQPVFHRFTGEKATSCALAAAILTVSHMARHTVLLVELPLNCCFLSQFFQLLAGPRIVHTEVASVLIDIESELRRLALWQSEVPSDADLSSQQPFAIDTLTLPQWLQFIFLPTMYDLIEDKRPLPSRCGITPMAEEYFRGSSMGVDPLLEALESIDRILSDEEPDYGVDRG
jgi:uncharacterized protein YqcC (DUF446 family)